MELLATNQTLTDNVNFDQLGTSSLEIRETKNYAFITLALDITINDSKNVQIKPFFEDQKNNNELYQFPIEEVKKSIITIQPQVKELDNDVSQRILVEFEIDNTIDLVQIGVRVDTLGATPAVINKAQFGLGYRQ